MTLLQGGCPVAGQQHAGIGFSASIMGGGGVGGAALGDTRRTARLVSLANCLADRPAASVPAACGTWAATNAAYRFFSNEAVDPSDVLAAHREACVHRIGGRPLVPAVQDTSVYNFTTHRATRGLGPLATHGAQSLAGFMVHTCLAVSPEGVPLGVLGQKLWVRPEREGRVPPKHHDHRPVAEKESVRWQAMLEESTRNLPPETRVLTIADREADIVDFFVAAMKSGQDLLVRAAYNRKLDNQDGYVWDAVERAEPVGYQTIEVPRGHDQPGRTVELELRIASITLRPPTHRRKLPPVPLRAVLARERNPLPDQEPIEWLLLTTLPVASKEDARSCLHWYTQRWKVERYHYTLKSGCLIEELQFEDVQRLHRALAVYAVVAWRLLQQRLHRALAVYAVVAWRLLHLTYLARV